MTITFTASPTPPFTINAFSLTRHPGESFTITGSGCPPTGSLPTSQVLVLRLTPPGGGNAFAPILFDGNVLIISTKAFVFGEADVNVTPNADGTFAASITIPLDAPAAPGYTVRGICTTVLKPGPGGFTQASFDASQAQAGSLVVIALPTPPITPPNFTG